MASEKYREFELVAEEAKKDENGLREFTVQVFRSPVGEGEKEVRKLPPELAKDLSTQLYRLEHRKLGVDAVIALGEALADLLLPVKSREFFTQSMDKLERGQGLRLRLRLDSLLVDIPWEYMYIQRGKGGKDETGFLALDPQVSIVRHEALGVSGDLDRTPRTRRVVAALASPEQPGYDPLNLDEELANLEKVLSGLPNLELEPVPDATIDALYTQLEPGADIFHFAGHGQFKETGPGESLRSILGEGELVFVTDGKTAAPIAAAQLAVNLQGHGVQLAVLGACQTGRRDGQNVWSGVVATLMEVGIPAAVAMQYKIWDRASIAFSRSFYEALATGTPLDWAVSAGRITAFNLCHPKRDDPELGKFWRDWGVPVLYLRSEQDFVLPAIVDETRRQAVAEGPQTVVNHRITEIGPKGKYKGVEAGVMEVGTISAYLKAIVIKGPATQVEVTDLIGGAIDARAEVERVEDEFVGVRVDHMGRPSTPAGPPPRPTSEAGQATCPNCSKAVEPEWKACPFCGTELPKGPTCPSCHKTVEAEWNACPYCGFDLRPEPTCPNCQKTVEAGWKVCPYCGATLRT
jgi:RNA polymerase subunit RPABC4/transcription elongation factor Spt4